jgi:hypothetical protein
MREFAPIMSSPENPEGMQNTIFPPTIGTSNCLELSDQIYSILFGSSEILN